MNLFDSLKVFFYVNKVFGLGFYKLEGNRLRSSKILTSIPLVAFVSLNVYIFLKKPTGPIDFFEFKTFAQIMAVEVYTAVTGTAVITMIITIVQNQKIMNIYNRLNYFDQELLDNFKYNVNYKRLYRKILIILGLISFYYGYDLVTACTRHEENWLIFVCFSITMWLSAVESYQYYQTVNLIKERFCVLIEITQEKDFNVDSHHHGNIHTQFYKLVDFIDDINEAFGVRILNSLGRELFFLAFQVFQTYWSNFDWDVIAIVIFVGSIQYFKVFMIPFETHRTIEMMWRTGQCLRNLKAKNGRVSHEFVRMSSLKQLHYGYDFMANDFFVVGLKSFFAVCTFNLSKEEYQCFYTKF